MANEVCLTMAARMGNLRERYRMEYTDAPSIQAPVNTVPCPLCGHSLPKDAVECDHCHWTRPKQETAEGKASDAFAVLLSIIPGLGHIYKGHKLVGMLLMFVATPMAVGLALLAETAKGLGLPTLRGVPLVLGVSVDTPELKTRDVGVGPTAPANLYHFVTQPGVAFVR